MTLQVRRDSLQQQLFGEGVTAQLFNGAEHELSDISLMFGEVQPGCEVALHRHSYEEIFIIHQGQADYLIGEETVSAAAGDIVIVPAGVPHSFANTGRRPLVQTAVHGASAVAIEWLE